MDTKELEKLAQKYLDGTATAEEKALLNQWYDTVHDGETEQVYTKNPETAEQVKARIFSRLQQKAFMETKTVKRSGTVRKLIIGITSAAAVLLILFFSGQKNTYNIAIPSKQLVKVPDHKIIQLLLPDGSKVWLSAGSVFKYPKKFDNKLRTVELLEGRAFFEIKHRNKHPFIVKTSSLNVTVLGTSFDVRAYKNEGTTKVSVVTGKVGITLKGPSKEPAMMLLPKQQAILSKVTNQIFKQVTKEIAVNAWCKSKLVFEQEDLGNVFKVLEKKYNTRINVDNKNLLNERISITLSNQHLDTIMEILSFTKHFKYEIANDSTVVIR
jgi:transmembrane sensor